MTELELHLPPDPGQHKGLRVNPQYVKDAFGNELVPGSFVVYSIGRRGYLVPAIVVSGLYDDRFVRLILRPGRRPRTLPAGRCVVVDVETIPLVARESLATAFMSREKKS